MALTKDEKSDLIKRKIAEAQTRNSKATEVEALEQTKQGEPDATPVDETKVEPVEAKSKRAAPDASAGAKDSANVNEVEAEAEEITHPDTLRVRELLTMIKSQGQDATSLAAVAVESAQQEGSAKDAPTQDSAKQVAKAVEFVTVQAIEEAEGNPTMLAQVFNSAIATAVQQAIQQATVEAMKTVPNSVHQQITTARAIDDFMAANRDLELYLPILEIEAKKARLRSPGATALEILESAGKEVRTRFNLAKPDAAVDIKAPPVVPTTIGIRNVGLPAAGVKATSTQRDIAEARRRRFGR